VTAQPPGSIDLLPVYGLGGVVYAPAWEVRALQRKANDEMLGRLAAALAGVGLDLFMRYPILGQIRQGNECHAADVLPGYPVASSSAPRDEIVYTRFNNQEVGTPYEPQRAFSRADVKPLRSEMD